MASMNGLQDSPMVDEVLDGSQMDVTDSEDSVMASHGTSNYSNLLNELTSNDRTVHSEFQNTFDIDFFNDKDLH